MHCYKDHFPNGLLMNPNGLLTFLTAKKSVDSCGPLPPFCMLPQIPQAPNSVPSKICTVYT